MDYLKEISGHSCRPQEGLRGSSVRLFVAIAVITDAREAGRSAIDELQHKHTVARAKVRWLAQESWHVTLQFVGEIDEMEMCRIAVALGGSWRQSSFIAGLAGGGIFPSEGTPRVIWFGLGQGGHEMALLQRETVRRLRLVGFRQEVGPYRAHLTVGRVKQVPTAAAGAMRRAVENVEIPSHDWIVDRVILYESQLSPKGSTYRVVVEAMLH